MNKISAIRYDLKSDAFQIVGEGGAVIATLSVNDLKKNLPDWFLGKDLEDYDDYELVSELQFRCYDFSQELDIDDIRKLCEDYDIYKEYSTDEWQTTLISIARSFHPRGYIDKEKMKETLCELVDQINSINVW